MIASSGQSGGAAIQRLPLLSWDALSRFGSAAAGYGLPFLLIVYLALKGGGYDPVVYSEVGIVAWWILLVAFAFGVLPTRRMPRIAWIGLGLLMAFAAWTALGIGWSESAERSVAELARVASYLGVFALAIAAQGRDALRRTVGGMATAIALVGLLALLSRLHPAWFPNNDTASFLPSESARLNYPLNYWNGLAALTAIGVPLLLVIALQARWVLSRALAAGAVPILATVAFYTFSRGGAIAIALSVLAFLALTPGRLRAFPIIAVAGVGSGLLIAAATQRNALEDGLTGAAAQTQADQMLAVGLVVCTGTALLAAAVSLAARAKLGPRPNISRRNSMAWLALVTGAAAVVAIAVGAPGSASNAWQDFKSNQAPGQGENRLLSASGNGRYQYWKSAIDANATDRLTGIGPGTYEYWWARNGTLPGFVRDAHSLFLETLAELGIVGLVLILGVIATPLAAGVRIARQGIGSSRQLAAGATAATVAFAVVAAIDWAWELPVLPMSFLLLAAALLVEGKKRADAPVVGPSIPVRAGAVAVAIAALIAIAIPYATTGSLRKSQAQAQQRALPPALERARDATNIQPYAATPHLQEALVLELQGNLGGAAASARLATREEPTNWRTWFVASRLEARVGDAQASVAAYRKARQLNPRSSLFRSGTS